MTEHDRRRIALRACGLDPGAPVTRAASYANETWIGEDFVLRVNYRGVGRLAREARIVAQLPKQARHPGILALGDDGAIEWSLSPRVRGIDLGRAWVRMSATQRERAIHELAGALAALHATPAGDIPDDVEPPHTLPLAPLLALVDDVAARYGRDLDAIADFIRARWDAFDARDTGLVHGDPHLENVLWDGEHVSALVDLEWSRPSWIHCDLEILLAIARDPRPFASADHAASVRRGLRRRAALAARRPPRLVHAPAARRSSRCPAREPHARSLDRRRQRAALARAAGARRRHARIPEDAVTFRSRELAVLRLIARGPLGWHAIEQHLAGQEPYSPGAPELQRRLVALGITSYTDDGLRYVLTDRGRDAVRQIEDNGWLLGPAETHELVTQLSAPLEHRLPVLAPFLDDPSGFPRIARQLHAAGLRMADVAWSAELVVREDRSAVAFEFVTHPSENVRAALFRAWGGRGEGADEPARFRAPNAPYEWATDPMFVDLLNVGLNDPSAEVRDAAARLVYLTQSGLHVTAELLANLASPTPSKWSAAALGTARDERSLAVLRALLVHPDERMAGMAVRALAARPDGHADFLSAFGDERLHVRWSAEMSLGELATGLDDDVLATLESTSANARIAVAFYRARRR